MINKLESEEVIELPSAPTGTAFFGNNNYLVNTYSLKDTPFAQQYADLDEQEILDILMDNGWENIFTLNYSFRGSPMREIHPPSDLTSELNKGSVDLNKDSVLFQFVVPGDDTEIPNTQTIADERRIYKWMACWTFLFICTNVITNVIMRRQSQSR